MPFKIDSAIMKLDTETGKYDLVDPDGKFPLFSNFVGGFVSAGVEYGSQVIGNIVSNGFSVESFTNVDVFDIGLAFGEGFITSGTNVARRVITKAAVELTGEIARNTVDIQVGYGTDHTPIVNSFGDVIVDTAIGVASEAINIEKFALFDMKPVTAHFPIQKFSFA